MGWIAFYSKTRDAQGLPAYSVEWKPDEDTYLNATREHEVHRFSTGEAAALARSRFISMDAAVRQNTFGVSGTIDWTPGAAGGCTYICNEALRPSVRAGVRALLLKRLVRLAGWEIRVEPESGVTAFTDLLRCRCNNKEMPLTALTLAVFVILDLILLAIVNASVGSVVFSVAYCASLLIFPRMLLEKLHAEFNVGLTGD